MVRIAGRHIVVLLIGIGVALAVFGIWHSRRLGRHAVEFWGTQSAATIANADEIWLLVLEPKREPTTETVESIEIDGGTRPVTRRIDISDRKGVSNLRRALLIDASYDWSDEADTQNISWRYALQFRRRKQLVVIGASLEDGMLFHESQKQSVSIRPIQEGFISFFSKAVNADSGRDNPAEN